MIIIIYKRMFFRLRFRIKRTKPESEIQNQLVLSIILFHSIKILEDQKRDFWI